MRLLTVLGLLLLVASISTGGCADPETDGDADGDADGDGDGDACIDEDEDG